MLFNLTKRFCGLTGCSQLLNIALDAAFDLEREQCTKILGTKNRMKMNSGLCLSRSDFLFGLYIHLTACLLLSCAARLSLDTMNMDSDGEKEDNEEGEKSIFQSIQEQTNNCRACPGDEIDGPKLRPWSRARVTSMVIKQQ